MQKLVFLRTHKGLIKCEGFTNRFPSVWPEATHSPMSLLHLHNLNSFGFNGFNTLGCFYTLTKATKREPK